MPHAASCSGSIDRRTRGLRTIVRVVAESALDALAVVAPGLALRRLSARDPRYALAGERLVERALRGRGWRFLARRLETSAGEADLLFVEEDTLVVVEVKTGRAGARFVPGMRVDARVLARLWRTARLLGGRARYRVDLVEVQLDERRRARLVHHHELRAPL